MAQNAKQQLHTLRTISQEQYANMIMIFGTLV